MNEEVRKKRTRKAPFKKNPFDAFLLFERTLVILMIAIIMIGICVHVFMRYLFGMPINWFIDVATLFLFFMTFLGAAWLLNEDGHVSMDFLFHMIGPRKFRKVETVINIGSAMACLLVAVFGVVEMIDAYQIETTVDIPSAPPKWIVLAMIPVGFVTLMIEFIRKALRNLSANDAPVEPTGGKDTD